MGTEGDKLMGALALPKRYSIRAGTNANPLAKRIGVRLNGVDRARDVVEYDVEKGYIVTNQGERFTGVVEPYWRT